jgi:hypothetical protein
MTDKDCDSCGPETLCIVAFFGIAALEVYPSSWSIDAIADTPWPPIPTKCMRPMDVERAGILGAGFDERGLRKPGNFILCQGSFLFVG